MRAGGPSRRPPHRVVQRQVAYSYTAPEGGRERRHASGEGTGGVAGRGTGGGGGGASMQAGPPPNPTHCLQLKGHLGLQGLELLVLGLGLCALRHAGELEGGLGLLRRRLHQHLVQVLGLQLLQLKV